MRKIWDWIVAQFLKVSVDKWLHFIAGLLVAAFIVIAIGWPGWAGLIGAVAAGLLKEAFDWVTTKKVELWDGIATAAGGLVVLFFWLLHLWWF